MYPSKIFYEMLDKNNQSIPGTTGMKGLLFSCSHLAIVLNEAVPGQRSPSTTQLTYHILCEKSGISLRKCEEFGNSISGSLIGVTSYATDEGIRCF